MVFDVMVRAGKNVAGKDIRNVYRVHDSVLSKYLRNVQDVGHYIESVIPLFRPKIKDVAHDRTFPGKMINPQGLAITEKDLLPEEFIDLSKNDFDGF